MAQRSTWCARHEAPARGAGASVPLRSRPNPLQARHEQMRYVIELRRTADDRVEGVVLPEGEEVASPFSGWLELLSLLEPPADATEH